MATKKKDTKLQEAFEDILQTIIDEWYERVSGYYVTEPAEGGSEASVELKRFHDENGHRIKFNKETLDFTYGLRSTQTGESLYIDISVNNKVEDFDYDDFQRQLFDHYRSAGRNLISRPSKLNKLTFQDIFQLRSGISQAFTVEKRNERADIMRLSFELNPDHLATLAQDPVHTKELIESYCVSPFRNIYARVYRSKA